MSDDTRPPYDWGSVVIWTLTLFLWGLTTSRPPHDPGMERLAFGLMLGIVFAVVGGLVVAVIKHFNRSPLPDSNKALASAIANDKVIFYGCLVIAAVLIGKAIYLGAYGALFDAAILVGLGFGVKNRLGFARWLLAADAFISAIIVVGFSYGNAVIFPIVFYAACRSIKAYRHVDRVGDRDNKSHQAVQKAPSMAKQAEIVPPTDAIPQDDMSVGKPNSHLSGSDSALEVTSHRQEALSGLKPKIIMGDAAAPPYAPIPASKSQSNNLNWLWWVAAVIVVTVLANTGMESGRQSPQPAPVVTPAPPVIPKPLVSDDAIQRSARMNKLFEAKDYYGVISEARTGQFMTSDLNILGIAFYSTGQFDDAIAIFKQTESAFPNDSIVKFNLGNALLANGQSIAALEKYREALAMEPSNQSYQQQVAVAKRAVDLINQSVHKGDSSIQWDNARYGVPLENGGTQKRQGSAARNSTADTSDSSREMEKAARLERAADIEKAARMGRTAKLEKERLERERLEKERLEREKAEQERLEKEKLKNNLEWLEREKESYRNRSF